MKKVVQHINKHFCKTNNIGRYLTYQCLFGFLLLTL